MSIPPAGKALIVDPDELSSAALSDALSHTWGRVVHWAANGAQGWDICAHLSPDLIFIELKSPKLDGLTFTRRLRLSDLPCRKAPVIMLGSQPTKDAILAARDAGAHEFLRKPYTLNELNRRIEAVTGARRDWVEGIEYVGPDRRRFNAGAYRGPRKRRVDSDASPEKARIGQALKIMKAALGAMDSNPRQALRALRAQADELRQAATATGDASLAETARAMRAYLETAEQTGRFSGRQFATDIGEMFAMSPKPVLPKKSLLPLAG